MNRVSSLCFIGMGSKLTVMRLYFCLVHLLLCASGKDKTMKRIPKTPIEFDYDLWTTEDGKCMVRVKLTGEVCEVSRETMRVLRNEEKKLRRSFVGTPVEDDEEDSNPILSLDVISEEDVKDASWLADPHDFTQDIAVKMAEEEFIKTLTSREKDVYTFCIKMGREQSEYAEKTGLSISRVCKIVAAIRKKAKIFF